MSTSPNPHVSTQLFRFLTPCDAETVWGVLAPCGEEAHYYGAPIVSDWQVGSQVELRTRVGGSIVGEVIAAEPGIRLSHTLGDTTAEPSVYITWTIHPEPGATVVRLYVDQVGPRQIGADDEEETERAWLPVLAALQRELDRLRAG